MINPQWDDCQFLTCSVLPVQVACNLNCQFCFSKSSISQLKQQRTILSDQFIHQYYQFAKQRGAKRLVITGGGEPLLKPDMVLKLIKIGRDYFSEIACFSNASYLTQSLTDELLTAGLSYLCYSRHHDDETACQRLMGKSVKSLDAVFAEANGLPIRATCVMCQGYIESTEDAFRYIQHLQSYGVKEFTFKHTYVSYEASVFQHSTENHWAQQHQIQQDPFVNHGQIIGSLPWGPTIRQIGAAQVCYYHEPHPDWEIQQQLCRSINLLADGKIYASLEAKQSQLFLPNNSNMRFAIAT